MEKIAAAEKKLQVKAALAGLFQNQLVYLYRDDSSMLDFFHFPVEKSNLALCILVRKHGGGETLKILRRAAGKDFDAAVFRERIAGLEKTVMRWKKTIAAATSHSRWNAEGIFSDSRFSSCSATTGGSRT